MGTIRAEWLRFRRRRLAPLLRCLGSRLPPAPHRPVRDEAMESLLVALLRAEIRRTAADPTAWSAAVASLRRLLERPRSGEPVSEVPKLVAAMLATPVRPATAEDFTAEDAA